MSKYSIDFKAIYERIHIPRKMKKRALGYKLNGNKLRNLLSKVILGPPIKTMYERRAIYPFYFCPKCGCESYFGSGNMTTYPEHWEKFKCIRCNNLIGYIDNSPFIHALECVDNNYDPTF